MRTRQIHTLICSVLFTLNAMAQSNAPSAVAQAPAPTRTVAGNPSAYGSGVKVNYVRTKEAMGRYTDLSSFDAAAYTDVKEATQYLDGLGRPLQTVVRQATPGSSPKDLVSPVVYDAFGREIYKYLPYVQTSGTNTNDGNFKINPFADQQNFYQSVYPSEQPSYTGEQFYYGETVFEASPLNRPLKTMAPGNSWAGSNRGVSMEYLINNSADAVKIWTVTFDALSYNGDATTNIPATGDEYDAGELYKNVTKDEAGNAVVEYKDKEGQVILKKVQTGTIATDYSGYAGFLCTYYVYDDLNQLRFVIPPKAVEWLINNGWNFGAANGTTEVVPELCFRYEYDARQRMIAKKVPGADWVYMVYDKRDRLIFTQDANMRNSNKWMTTLYDALNRPVLTGFITYTGNRQQLQDYAESVNITASSQTINGNSPGSFPAELTLSNYTAGLHQASSSIILNPGFETAPEFTAEIATGNSSGSFSNEIAVENIALPPDNNFDPLTMTFYDGYAWTDKTYNTQNNALLPGDAVTEHAESLPAQASQQTKGLVTGTKVKNLGNNEWLTAVSFYDDRDRVIQSSSINHAGGEDVVTTRYDFTGKALSSLLLHNNPKANTVNLKVLTRMQYDHAGRLLIIKKKINEGAEVVIAENEYDAMGQLKKKKLGQKKDENGNYTTEPLETLDYTYNIRGWLKGINKDYSAPSGSPEGGESHWFGMELSYDWGFANNQFNGNISGTKWRSRGDGERRSYGFGYDPANRLLAADFNQYTNGSWDKSAGINFSSYMGDGVNAGSAYDANGNIKAMKQWGLKGTASTVTDEMAYGYFNNNEYSNKLKTVTESATIADMDNKLGDFTDKNRSGDDYSYDANGNLLMDKNKNISSITYNHLNLPAVITVTGKGTITYTYDAAGNKLKKETIENNVTVTVEGDIAIPNVTITTTTNYINGMLYESRQYSNSQANTALGYADKLQFLGHEEGRIRYTPPAGGAGESWVYDYFVKDHLGNTRVVLTDEQQTNAYPVASMEIAQTATEEAVYRNISSTREDKPSGYPADTYTNPNDKVAKVNGSGNKIGPAILLRVMAGDKFNLRVNSWYKTNGTAPGTVANPLADIVTALINGVPAISGGHIQTGDLTTTILNPNIGEYLNNRDNGNTYTVKPKAYINAILLDDRFKAVITQDGKNSWFEQVGANEEFKEHLLQGREITKNGYLYIYVSNETENINVFFDNLQVTHIRGPLLEETHYYPFGLIQQGISSQALKSNYVNNKIKFQSQELQSKEFSDGSGLETYEFKYRMDDPQIGRFWSIDPLADKYVYNSTYAFSENKVIAHVELEGLESKSINDAFWRQVKYEFQNAANWIDNTFSFGSKTKVEVPVTSSSSPTKGTVVVETTTENQTKLGPAMDYIMTHNTNKGYTDGILQTNTKTTVSAQNGAEMSTPLGSVKASNSVDQNGKSTTTGDITVKNKSGLGVGATASSSSNGDQKVGFNVNASEGNTTLKAGVTATANNNSIQNVEFNFIIQQKIDNTRVSHTYFITVGNH